MANDLVIKIKADSSGVKPAIDGAEKSVVDLGQKGRKSSSDIAEGFAQVIAAIGRVDSSLTAMTGHINAGFGGVSTAMASARTQTVAVESAVEREKRAVDGADRSLNTLGADGAKAGKQVAAGMDGAAKSADMLGIVAKGVIGYFSVSAVVGFAKSVLDAGIAMDSLQRSFSAIAGSKGGAEAELQFLREESERLGQSFFDLAPAYKSVAAASRGTALEGENTRKIFSAVTEASTALGLSSADAEGALRAIGQMMSKGTVQAEELRGQLGERLPGAFKLMADALGVSQQELNKMLEQGQVLSEDALPKLASAIHKAYGAAAETAALESGQAAVNRLSQEWEDLKSGLYDGGAFVAATGYVTTLVKAMRGMTSEWSIHDKLVAAQDELKGLEQIEGSPMATLPGFDSKLDAARKEVRKLKDELFQLESPAKDSFQEMQKGMAGASSHAQKLIGDAKKASEELAKLTQTPRQKVNAKADELLGKGADPAMVEDYRRKEISKIAEQEASKTKRGSAGPSLDMDGYGKSALAEIQAESQRKMDLLKANLASEMAVVQRGYDAGTTSLEAYYAERRRIIEAESQAEIQAQQNAITQAQTEIARLQQLKPQGTRGAEQISDQIRALQEKIKDAEAAAQLLGIKKQDAMAENASDEAKAARERITQAMSDAQSVITSTEQSLQSRVVTGLETEATARAKLKSTIQEQGAALEQDLVPQIERMMLVAGNPKARAELHAMLDKIREMAAEAKTQTWADGLKQGAEDYATSASDAFQTARDAATSAFSSMEDALVEFTTTGKLSVSDMVTSMLADIARLAIRQSITQPLASGVGNVIQQLLGGGSSWAGVNTSWSGAATTSASIMGNSGYGLAGGGRVTGPGTDTSDSVPIDASRDEYVIKAASARKIGYDRLDYANVHGELPERHAQGGIVGRGDRRSPITGILPIDRTVDRSTLERMLNSSVIEREHTMDRSTIERTWLPSISNFSNTVQSSPVAFDASGFRPFALGGVFGEAGPEAVMPLTRTSDGRLGVASTGGATQAKVNVTVHNTAGAQVRIEEGQTSNGEPDIKVMIENIAAGAVGRHGSSMNQALRQGGFRQPLVRRGF